MPEKAPSNRPASPGNHGAGRRHGSAHRAGGAALCRASGRVEFLLSARRFASRGAGRGRSVLGLAGFSIADRNTLAGVVRGHLAARTTGVRYAVGCRLVFRDGTPDIAVWPHEPRRLRKALPPAHHRQSPRQEGRMPPRPRRPSGMGRRMELRPPGRWRVLRRLPSQPRGAPRWRGRVRAASSPPSPLLPPPSMTGRTPLGRLTPSPLSPSFPARVGSARLLYDGDYATLGRRLSHSRSQRRSSRSATCSTIRPTAAVCRTCSPASASTDARQCRPAARDERRASHEEPQPRWRASSPTIRKPSPRRLRLFERLNFSLDELSHEYEYPLESAGESATPFDELVRLTWEGAAWRYPQGVPRQRAKAHRARARRSSGS